MPGAHRQDDLRICGATTIVVGHSSVYVNDKLWAVKDDINTDNNGQLINTGTTVLINDKYVIVNTPDHAEEDDKCPLPDHCDPYTDQGSSDVFAY